LPAVSALPGTGALRAAAAHSSAASWLAPSSSTGSAKGLYRLESLADAQAHADAALARVIADCERERRRRAAR
jgi:hypothetical protein